MEKQTKQIIAIVLIAIASCFADSVFAQKVTKDATGNYTAVQTAKKSKAKETGKTYTGKDGKVYPVYISVNDKLFIRKVSKTGNEYNYYLKVD